VSPGGPDDESGEAFTFRIPAQRAICKQIKAIRTINAMTCERRESPNKQPADAKALVC
jgi:hypothetical protein